MSSKNNVNPGQYKVAGRERPGENLGQERDRQLMAKSRESYGPPRHQKEPRTDRASVLQPRDKSESGGTRKKTAEKPDRQAPARNREISRTAKRASKRSEQQSGRSRKKTSRKAA